MKRIILAALVTGCGIAYAGDDDGGCRGNCGGGAGTPTVQVTPTIAPSIEVRPTIAPITTVAPRTDVNQSLTSNPSAIAAPITNIRSDPTSNANAVAAPITNVRVDPTLNSTSNAISGSTSRSDASANSASFSGASAHQGQLQGQLQGQQQQASAVTGASTATSQAATSGNTQSMTYNEAQPLANTTQLVKQEGGIKIKNTPDTTAVIASPTAPCRIQMGAGASAPGLGLSLGGSTLDEGCDAREDARLLYNMGLHSSAVSRLCQKPEMAQALGTMCPTPEAAPAPAAYVGWSDPMN
jgi:hypothetical protein